MTPLEAEFETLLGWNPGMRERLLREHTPDSRGWCRVCHSSQSCTLYRLVTRTLLARVA